MSLFRKYRPKSWKSLIGHDQLKESIKRMGKTGTLGGRAFLLSGPSGIGKSSAGYLIAADVCDHENIVEVNATTVTPKTIQDWAKHQGQMLIGEKPGKAFVINECHKLRTDVVTLLLDILEHIRPHCVWVFTTQGQSKQLGLFNDEDSKALESRCVKYKLNGDKHRVLFAEFAKAVAEREDLGGASMNMYLAMADECDCNLREMLSRVEAGEMMERDDEGWDMDELFADFLNTV